jgi:hypothetical protein
LKKGGVEMKKHFFVFLSVLAVALNVSNSASAGLFSGYIVPTTTVINGSSYILKITQIRNGTSNVVREGAPGENLVFQTRLENLTILGSGERSATYLTKAYDVKTGKFYAPGPNIVLIRDSGYSSGTITYNYVTRVNPRGVRTRAYKTYSSGHRYHYSNYRYYYSNYRSAYTEDTIVVYVGDGIDPLPITIRNENLIPAEDSDQPPF